jgi:hypothetical protein
VTAGKRVAECVERCVEALLTPPARLIVGFRGYEPDQLVQFVVSCRENDALAVGAHGEHDPFAVGIAQPQIPERRSHLISDDDLAERRQRWAPHPTGCRSLGWSPSATGRFRTPKRCFSRYVGFGQPVADMLQPMPYTAVQQSLDVLNPLATVCTGNRRCCGPSTMTFWRRSWTTRRRASPLSAATLEFYGGAINRVAVPDTAYPLRDATYALNAVSTWTGPAQDEVNIGWSRQLWEAVQPLSPGSVYVNFLGVGDEGVDRTKAAYGPNYERLTKIKARYDPSNLFRPIRTSGRLAKSPRRLVPRADPGPRSTASVLAPMARMRVHMRHITATVASQGGVLR